MTEVTGGDLMSLWRVAKIRLPLIADGYVRASQMVGGVGGAAGVEAAFIQTRPRTELENPDSFFAPRSGSAVHEQNSSPGAEVTGVGRVYPYWATLRNELQHILASSAQNSLDAAVAVNMALNEFRGVDDDNAESVTEAGAEFDGLLADENYVDPDDPSQNPPVAPLVDPEFPVDSSGEPYESPAGP